MNAPNKRMQSGVSEAGAADAKLDTHYFESARC